jgi:anti-sigma factor RsiW
VRNAAIDNLRRGGRIDLTASDERFDGRSAQPEPHEKLFAALDTALIASAFRTLPERWRSVLWLTEVEGMEPREVADVMRITPNNAAQLAVRARAALRTRFLQAHVGDNFEDGCRDSVEKLGAYVSGKLAARDIAAVDQHLAGCAACQARAAELEDVGSRLRKIVLPLPLAFAPKGLEMLTASSVTSMGAGDRVGAAQWSDLATRLQKPLATAAASLVAVGVIALGVLGPSGRLPDNRAPLAAPIAKDPAVVPIPATAPIATSLSLSAADAPAASDGTSLMDDLAAAPAQPAPEIAAPAPAAPTDSSGPEGPADSSGGESPLGPVTEASPVIAQVEAEIVIEPVSATVSLGLGEGSCTDVVVADTAILGCGDEPAAEEPTAPTADEGNHITVNTETEITGEQSVSVPVPAL